MDWAARQKQIDPYNFVKAEDYFEDLNRDRSGTEQANIIARYSFNEGAKLSERRLVLHFDNGRALLVRFVRPRVWQLRCSHHAQSDSVDEEHGT